MGDAEASLPFSRKLNLLLQEGKTTRGEKLSTAADIARQTGVSHQTIMNLLQGHSHNPRLNTLRALCEIYGITLDYFDCASEYDCRVHLLQRAVCANNPTLSEIKQRSDQLAAHTRKRVMTLITWVELGSRAQLAQQQRKNR